MFANTLSVMQLAESGQPSWDMIKQTIQTQYNLALFGITVLIAVAFIAIAFNIYQSRRQAKREIESLKSEIEANAEEVFGKLTERTIEAAKKIREELEKGQQKRFTLIEAEKARLFALTASHCEMWENAVSWWTEAIVEYAKLGAQKLLRACVNALIRALQKCDALEDVTRKDVKKCLHFIPEILAEEKKKIKDTLDKLPKEAPKEEAKEAETT